MANLYWQLFIEMDLDFLNIFFWNTYVSSWDVATGIKINADKFSLLKIIKFKSFRKQTKMQPFLTNLDELSFLTVFAFPKASRIGFAFKSCCSSSPFELKKKN